MGGSSLQMQRKQEPDAYTSLLLQHMQTLVAVEQDAEADNIMSLLDGMEPISKSVASKASVALIRQQPNPRLRIHLLHSSTLNSGIKITTTDQEETNAPTWDNLGEVYFRGTLRDLDSAYLEVCRKPSRGLMN